MEEEALAKLQREKRNTLSTSAPSSSSAASSSKPKPCKSSAAAPQPRPSSQRPEKDLIVFPETKKQAAPDQFRDIDVDKLTTEELEKLLLDENFGAHSKVSRPSSLLGFNLSASYPGGHTCSPSPFQSSQWASVLSTPSSSSVSTPTHQPTPMFPSAPFPKPGSFQNGFTPTITPYMGLPAQQPPFITFTPIQPPAAMVFPPPAVDPEMAKLFDKIASTSEYLKNGKLAGTEVDSSQAGPASLAPDPPPQQQPAAPESAGISRFDWLDLDPLTKRKAENEEVPQASGGPAHAEPGVPAGDPWDAVLETEGSGRGPSLEAETSARSQQRRASTGAAVTRSHSLNVPGTSSQHKADSQVGAPGGGGGVLSVLSLMFGQHQT